MIEVTQEDREAAERWGTGPVYNMQHLAEAFARHRFAAEQRGMIAARDAAVKVAQSYESGLKGAPGWSIAFASGFETGMIDASSAIAQAIATMPMTAGGSDA